MKILIAEDDVISRRLLETTLIRWGYEVVVTCDGTAAWEVLQSADAPPLAILDWMMPGTDGIEVCRKVRRAATPTPPYLILLTAKGRREDIVAGLRSGANDYVTKPFNREELRARVQVGMRIVELQHSLAERVKALEEALARVKQPPPAKTGQLNPQIPKNFRIISAIILMTFLGALVWFVASL